MNFNQLEYFISAADNLNFTKAARECYISQTAMTQQIQALEKNLGVKLFLRDKHHIELTTAGSVYLKEARAMNNQIQEEMEVPEDGRLITLSTCIGGKPNNRWLVVGTLLGETNIKDFD